MPFETVAMTGADPRRAWFAKVAGAVAGTLLLASSVLVFRAADDIRARDHLIDDTRRAQFRSEQFIATLTDAETGQRGYLLTGDSSYLELYTSAVSRLSTQMAGMKLVPIPQGEGYLDRIGALSAAKMEEIGRTIALRKSGQADAALAIVRNNSGQHLMDAVRGEIGAMQKLGRSRLARARAQAATDDPWSWPIGMTALAAVLLVFVARAWMRVRDLRALHVAARDSFVRAFGLTRGMLRDLDGRITFWGSGMTSLYGYEATVATGRVSHELLATRFPLPLAELEATLLATGEWTGELTNRCEDGSLVTVISRWVLHRDVTSRVLSVVEMNHDISAMRRTETQLQVALDAAGLGIWSWDVGSGPLQLDAQCKALLRLDGDFVAESPFDSSGVSAEDYPALAARMTRLLDPADPVDADSWEFRPAVEAAEPIWLAASCRVQFMPQDGAPAERRALRMVGTMRDVSDARRADQERKQAVTLLLRTIVDTAPGPIYAKDRGGRFMLANEAALTLLGRPWADVQGHTDLDLLGDVEQARVVVANDERIMASGDAEAVEERVGGDTANMRTWLSNKTPIRAADGHVVGLVGVSVEITGLKRAEASQDLMIHELNHRVKNTLATVQAISSETLGNAPPAIRAALEGRLLALAAVHDVLTREVWQGADLHELISGALRPFGGAGGGRFAVSGPPLPLVPRAALAIAMGLHELATNAVKYGALQTTVGTVTINWEISEQDDPRLKLTWTERGGPVVTVPATRSFGTRMIEGALAWDMCGTATIHFDPAGLRCVIDAPLAEVAAGDESAILPKVGRR